MSEALIQMEDIKKVFLTEEVETHALSDVSFAIASGEFVSIAGPSGSGKTTLLSILGLLDTATDGLYMLNGNDVSDLTASERARVRNREIGFIFQSFNLIGDLNVYENVELPLTYRGMSSSERREKVNAALDRVGMTRTAPSTCRASSRVVSSSVWPWPERSLVIPRSCLLTSPLETSTRAMRRR